MDVFIAERKKKRLIESDLSISFIIRYNIFVAQSKRD